MTGKKGKMLILEVISYKGIAPPGKISAAFDKVGGGIGRGDINALILPDADRYISRMHARISYRSGRYFIEDHGTATPVIVNGRILGKGIDSAIDHGDEVRIGDYGMRVLVQDYAAPSTLSSTTASSAGFNAAAASDPMAETRAMVAERGPIPQPERQFQVRRAAVQPAVPETPSDPLAQTQRLVRQPAIQDAAVRAFFEGAGIADQQVLSGPTPQSLYAAGQVLRETLQALLDLQLMHAVLQRDNHLEAQRKITAERNPLKSLSDVQVALAYLLNPQAGSMPPAAAVIDACNDLRAHQFAFMEGVRAALQEILHRFDPESLEQHSIQKTALDAVLPGQRKARLWDQFSDSYRELSQQAENDFHALFGREFRRLYAAHFDQLSRDAHEKPG
jgi:FHA domain-containing protein